MGQMSSSASPMGSLDQRAVVKRLLVGRKDLLVVTGLGSSSFDVMAAVGVAAAKAKHSVLVLTGGGEMLIGFGAPATIAVRKPANLTIAVLDNGHYGETGMQVSHAGRGISLDQVARTCGFAWTAEIRDMAGVDDLRARLTVHDGVKFACIKITADTPPRVLPPRDGVHVKNRFRAALGYGTI